MKILQFRDHAHDPLSWVIKEATREEYVHSAALVNEATHEIIEAYYPHVRKRVLADAELAGIDVFAIDGITPAQEAAMVAWLEKARTDHAPYSIANLFRFEAPFRLVIGEAQSPTTPNASEFCSQLVFSAAEYGAGIKLLNTQSYKVAPGYLTWSTRLKQVAALTPLAGGNSGETPLPLLGRQAVAPPLPLPAATTSAAPSAMVPVIQPAAV